MSSRRSIRERVLRGLYAFELGGGEAEEVIKRVVSGPLVTDDSPSEDAATPDSGSSKKPGPTDAPESSSLDDRTARRFAERLFLLTLDTRVEADEIISEHTRNWDLSRIALIDHLLLRMAICELLRFEDIPPKVSINEAIELAKRYSTGNSGKFVNGILDAVLARLKEEGRVRKSGRGLIGMDDPGERAAS